MNKLYKTLTSRKFLAAVVALIVVFFGQRGGLSGDQVAAAVVVLVGYITGQGVADAGASIGGM